MKISQEVALKPHVDILPMIPAEPKLPDLDLKSPKGPIITKAAPIVDNKSIERNKSSEDLRKP